MNLTIEDIRRHISEYQARIQIAEQQIDLLPSGFLPYQQHRKRQAKESEAELEIVHCETLIRYALEGISIRQEGE